jgi:hypothetical protein
MWETDLGYFGVPNGEQVKPARSRNCPWIIRTRFGQSRLYMLLVVYVQSSLFNSEFLTVERVYVYVFRQQ